MRLLVLAVSLCSALAYASGFYFGDNGTKALAQGYAFTAQADDLSAMNYNPAGLAQLDGLHFLADLEMMNHDVTFLRQDPGFDPNAPNQLINVVKNTGGLFLLPALGVSYRFPIFGRGFTVSLGVYAPPTVGRNAYQAPNYEKNGANFVENPRKFAPQRYAIINNDLFIAYPTLSLAYAIHPRFQVGVSLQLVMSHFLVHQALFVGDSVGLNPMRQLDENPEYDALATANVAGRTGFTGILGVMAKPLDWLQVGASIRPPIPIYAAGTLDVTLAPNSPLAQAATVEGNKGTLTFTMPLEIRAGVRVTPVTGLGVNADFVYQGWNSIDALVMTPLDLALVQGDMRTTVAPVRLTKNWVASYSGRLGASYDVVKYLTVHLGAMYETSVSPPAYYSVDFPHPNRFFFTGGLTGHLGPIDVVAAFALTPTVSTTVTESEVRRQQTDPSVTAGVIGTGLYTSGGWVASVGVRGHFFEQSSATP